MYLEWYESKYIYDFDIECHGSLLHHTLYWFHLYRKTKYTLPCILHNNSWLNTLLHQLQCKRRRKSRKKVRNSFWQLSLYSFLMVLLFKSEFQGYYQIVWGYTDGDTRVMGLSELLTWSYTGYGVIEGYKWAIIEGFELEVLWGVFGVIISGLTGLLTWSYRS